MAFGVQILSSKLENFVPKVFISMHLVRPETDTKGADFIICEKNNQ